MEDNIWINAYKRGLQGTWSHPDPFKVLDSAPDGAMASGKRDEQAVRELRPIPEWDNITAVDALMILTTHNAYHAGQVVLLRKMLGAWKET